MTPIYHKILDRAYYLKERLSPPFKSSLGANQAEDRHEKVALNDIL